jgi:hypothetical protein
MNTLRRTLPRYSQRAGTSSIETPTDLSSTVSVLAGVKKELRRAYFFCLALVLATDFPRLWNDRGTANRERKRMVRLPIEDITIRKGEQIQLDIRFRGGAVKTLMLPKPLSFCESHRQNPAMVAEMDRLLGDYNYAETARILNEKGFKTGDGLPLTPIAVGYVRKAYGLKSRFDRLRERGLLTMSEMAKPAAFR